MTAPVDTVRPLVGRRSNDATIAADVRADMVRAHGGDTAAAERLAAYRAEVDARVSAIGAKLDRVTARRIRQSPARAAARAAQAADRALADRISAEYRAALAAAEARDTVEHAPPVRLPGE